MSAYIGSYMRGFWEKILVKKFLEKEFFRKILSKIVEGLGDFKEQVFSN